MQTLRRNLPLLLLIVFELAVGILLFLKPVEFTQGIIITLGVLLLVIGAIDLFRFLRDRKSLGVNDYLTLSLAILALLCGAFLAFGSKLVMGLFGVLAVLYGIFLIVSGLLKGKTYFEFRRAGFPVSVLLLVNAILSVLLGMLIVLHPFDSVDVLWRFTGVSLIVEAIGDAISLLLAAGR